MNSERVYISARFSRRAEMQEVSKAIKALGYEDVSRWLVLEESEHPTEAMLRERARVDKQDVHRCDILVRFSDDLSEPTVPSQWCTASRFEETGMADALGKIVIIVGGPQSLFDRLETRIHVKDTAELYAKLRAMFYESLEY
jgi:hypothetical protein